MRRQVDVATMTISRSERRSDPQSIVLRGQKREVFGLSATYPLIEVLLKINRSNWHPLEEINRPKANAKDNVSSFPKTGKQHLTLRPATHLARSNHRLLWAAIMHTPHCKHVHLRTLIIMCTLRKKISLIEKKKQCTKVKFQRILLTKKRDENDVQKVWIRYFGVLHHQQGRYKEKLSLVTILYTAYSVPTTTSPYTCPVGGVAHWIIGFRLFVHRFRLAFWSIKSFETSECESRIAGRSPCYAKVKLLKLLIAR